MRINFVKSKSKEISESISFLVIYFPQWMVLTSPSTMCYKSNSYIKYLRWYGVDIFHCQNNSQSFRCTHVLNNAHRIQYSSPQHRDKGIFSNQNHADANECSWQYKTEIYSRTKYINEPWSIYIFQVVFGLFYCNRIIENQRVVFPSVNSGTFIYPVAFSWSTPVW